MKKLIAIALTFSLMFASTNLRVPEAQAVPFAVINSFNVTGPCNSLSGQLNITIAANHTGNAAGSGIGITGLNNVTITNNGTGSASVDGAILRLFAGAQAAGSYSIGFSATAVTNVLMTATLKVDSTEFAGATDTDTANASANCNPLTPPVIVPGIQSSQHDNTQPTQVVTKTDTCNGEDITGFTAVGPDISNVNTTINANNAIVEYDVNNPDGKVNTSADITLECTNPAGTDNFSYAHEFLNQIPTFNTSFSVGHTHGAAQTGTITITATDPNATDLVRVNRTGGDAGFTIDSISNGNPGELVLAYDFADGFVGTKQAMVTVTDEHPDGTVYSTQNNEVVTLTFTDSPATATPNTTGVQIGGVDIGDATEVSTGDTTTVPVQVEDIDDPGILIVFTLAAPIPGLDTTGSSLLDPGGVLPNGSNYNLNIEVTDEDLVNLPATFTAIGTDPHGNLVTAEFTIGRNSVNGRRRNDGVGTDIVQGSLHGDDNIISLGTDGNALTTITGGSGNDTIFFNAADEQEKACWLVARNYVGGILEFPEKVPKPASDETKEEAKDAVDDVNDGTISGKDFENTSGYDSDKVKDYLNGEGGVGLDGFMGSTGGKIVFEGKVISIGGDVYGSGYEGDLGSGFSTTTTSSGGLYGAADGGYIPPEGFGLDGYGLDVGFDGGGYVPPEGLLDGSGPKDSGLGVKGDPGYMAELGGGEEGAVGEYGNSYKGGTFGRVGF